MKCKGNASISQRCPDLEGEGARAPWKKSQGDWKGKEEKDLVNLGLVSWKMYFPRRQMTSHLRTFITVGHSSVGSEVGIKTLSVWKFTITNSSKTAQIFFSTLSQTLLGKKDSAIWNTVVTWGQGQRFSPWLNWWGYTQKSVRAPHSDPTKQLIIRARRQSMLISVKSLSWKFPQGSFPNNIISPSFANLTQKSLKT